MSALHLLWIIPIVATMGFVIGAVLSRSREEEIKEAMYLLIKNLSHDLEIARKSAEAARKLGDEHVASLYETKAKAVTFALEKIITLVNSL